MAVNQVKPSNCFRCIEKSVLPSIFETSLSSLMKRNLQSYPATVLDERMWHFLGVKTYSDPSHIFSGVKTPSTAMIYALNMNISDERHRKCYDRDIEGDGRAVNGVRLHRRRPSLASQFAQNKQWNLWIFIMYKFQVCAPLSSRFTLH